MADELGIADDALMGMTPRQLCRRFDAHLAREERRRQETAYWMAMYLNAQGAEPPITDPRQLLPGYKAPKVSARQQARDLEDLRELAKQAGGV